VKEILKKYWGYTTFRPFQEETIQALLNGQDTLTVLPTGGGKSLCFQIPALLKEGMAVVISPLISLMKDQVDALKEMGIPADYLNSSMTPEEQNRVVEKILGGELKLLYLAPERLNTPATLRLLGSVPLSFFVIDEAHCISEWGHDFREDYRKLGMLKETFKETGIHAFTATATEAVQGDILKLLKLNNPHITIAPVDRPNLTFRIYPRSNFVRQITNLLDKHKGEPGIIYCLRRADVDELSSQLNDLGIKNVPYHAGLSDEKRKDHHEQFSREEVDIVVATIAFGMGIDRSNIRFVIHAAMPKSLEHYQQETGRAGRDGLPSFCYLLYSGADFGTWTYLLKGSKNEAVMTEKLNKLYRFCTQPQCRHKALVHYFGQVYPEPSCKACDYCLGEIEQIEEGLIVAQKIISCVLRVKERFGADHIARVLKGTPTENIERWGHQSLSTFGLISDKPVSFIRSLIEQLLGQNFLKREPEHATLSVTPSGWQILRGELTPVLAKPVLATEKKKEIAQKQKRARAEEWQEVDSKLFEILRKKRKELATEKRVPAFIIFGDRTLREMARIRPVTQESFASVYGIGERKREAYAEIFIKLIKQYLLLFHGTGALIFFATFVMTHLVLSTAT